MCKILVLNLTAMLILSMAITLKAETNDIQSTNKNIVSITCADNILTLNEPLVIVFRAFNPLTETLQIDLGFDRKGGFQYILIKPDGSKTVLENQRQGGISREGVVTVRPGEAYSQLLVINEWHEFSAPGIYVLEVRIVNPIKTQMGQSIESLSDFRFEVEIQPRNEKRLIDKCEKLLTLIRSASSHSEAAGPAYILSHVEDKIAISYLTQLFTLPVMVEHFAIDGLARIGDQEATNALIFSLKLLPRDMLFVAQHALLEIYAKSNNSTIKNAIRQATSQ